MWPIYRLSFRLLLCLQPINIDKFLVQKRWTILTAAVLLLHNNKFSSPLFPSLTITTTITTSFVLASSFSSSSPFFEKIFRKSESILKWTALRGNDENECSTSMTWWRQKATTIEIEEEIQTAFFHLKENARKGRGAWTYFFMTWAGPIEKRRRNKKIKIRKGRR